MEENKKKEEEELDRKNKERQLERDRRNFKKVGKMPMRKIYAPPVKKVEVKKKAYTAEEEDIISYGLKVLLDAQKISKRKILEVATNDAYGSCC